MLCELLLRDSKVRSWQLLAYTIIIVLVLVDLRFYRASFVWLLGWLVVFLQRTWDSFVLILATTLVSRVDAPRRSSHIIARYKALPSHQAYKAHIYWLCLIIKLLLGEALRFATLKAILGWSTSTLAWGRAGTLAFIRWCQRSRALKLGMDSLTSRISTHLL